MSTAVDYKRRQIVGRGIPVPGNDIDTDRIIPARFLKEVTFETMGQHAFEDRHGPRAIIEFVRAQMIWRINLIAGVGVLPIERNGSHSAAALLAMGAIPFISQKPLQHCQQKTAELALFAVRRL